MIKDNPAAYIGDGGQLRLEPVRKLAWGREGMHFILGLVVAGMVSISYLFGSRDLVYHMVYLVQPLMMVLFICYEVTEGLRINDWAYRDIGGYMGGWIVGMGVYLVVSIFL